MGNLSKDILKLWVKGFTPIKIYESLDGKYEKTNTKKKSKNKSKNKDEDTETMDIEKINKYINSFKTILPWHINSTIIFLKEKNEKEKLPEICDYVPSMFKLGIFNPSIAVLMNKFNDLEKCEEYLNKHEINNMRDFEELIRNIEENKQDIEDIEENKEEYEEEIIITEEINVNVNEQFLVRIENNNLLLYNMDGELIKSIYIENYTINNNTNSNLNVIWKIETKKLNNIILKKYV